MGRILTTNPDTEQADIIFGQTYRNKLKDNN